MTRELKIAIDCRYVRLDGRHDGISRYSAGIVEALGRLHPVTMLISDDRQLQLLPGLPYAKIASPTSPLEPLVALQVNRLKPDVVWSAMQTMGSFGRRYPLVLTLHDLIYYRHRTPPAQFAWWVRVLWRLYHLSWWPQRFLLSRADALVTVSETTARLMRENHLGRTDAVVVYNAADALPVTSGSRPATDRMPPEKRSLVYMGAFLAYKNVEALVRAAARLPEYTLHLMSRVSPEDRARLRALAPDADLVFHNGASDEEYAETLRNATALVTASLDEGFGIPVVEGMSVGTPAVISDIPIFREVGGDAAVYFDPRDDASIVDAVRSLEDPGEWRRRSVAGVERAAAFSWDASAAVLLQLLEKTARDPGRR